MRLLADVPEIEHALKSGAVSLSTLSTIQSFVQRKEEPVSKSEKKDLVLALQGKSRRECERHLVALDPMAASPKEKERVISPTQTEIRFVADDELMQKLQKIRELDGHVSAGASYLELFHRTADLALKKLDPLSPKKTRAATAPLEPPQAALPGSESTPPAEFKTQGISNQSKDSRPRFISADIKREIWKRDQAQCAFKGSDGKRCGSKFALEIDHKVPIAWGGKSSPSNLQLLCREHNRQKAIAQLGSIVMRCYLR